MVGMLIGAALAGTFADKFGRKKSIYMWVLVASVSLICHSFVMSLTLNTIFRTLEMMIAHMAWIPHISYCVEIVGPKEEYFFTVKIMFNHASQFFRSEGLLLMAERIN